MHLNWNARLCKEIFTLRNRRCQTLKQTVSYHMKTWKFGDLTAGRVLGR